MISLIVKYKEPEDFYLLFISDDDDNDDEGEIGRGKEEKGKGGDAGED